jgi:hypothetical protein
MRAKYSLIAAAIGLAILSASAISPASATQDEQRGGYSTLSSGRITTGVNPVYHQHKHYKHHKAKVAPKK